MEPDYLVKFNGVDFRYPDLGGRPSGRKILMGIDLQIRRGEFTTIVGPSGCGKSSLLNLVTGFHRPCAGMVSLDESEVTCVDGHRGIVFQDYSVYPHLTVIDNVALGIVMDKTTLPQRLLFLPKSWKVWREAREKAKFYLDKIGLSLADGKKYPGALSGGMRQRVAFAAALITEPKIMLMDEPNSALDDRTRREMQAFTIQQWRDLGLTILYVTHNVEEAVHLGTRILGLTQYWKEDSATEGAEGARVVMDLSLPRASEGRRLDSDFVDVMKWIRADVLDTTKLLPRSQFRLEHPDVVRTTAATPVTV